MIRVTIYKRKTELETEHGSETFYYGYHIEGHAMYAEYGQDIVCAAVSALGINTANALLELTTNQVVCDMDEDGLLQVNVQEDVDDHGQLLLKAFVMGIETIYEDYGNTYIQVEFEEV